MTAQPHAVRHAIFLSFLMVGLASTAAAATKYAAANVSTEAIVTIQYLVCTLLCLPRILRPGVANLRTRRLGLHLLRKRRPSGTCAVPGRRERDLADEPWNDRPDWAAGASGA